MSGLLSDEGCPWQKHLYMVQELMDGGDLFCALDAPEQQAALRWGQRCRLILHGFCLAVEGASAGGKSTCCQGIVQVFWGQHNKNVAAAVVAHQLQSLSTHAGKWSLAVVAEPLVLLPA